MPKWDIVRQIVIHYYSSETIIYGIEFFDYSDKLLLSLGDTTYPDAKQLKIMLNKGDQVIGVKSKYRFPGLCASCMDFEFIFGRQADWIKL